MSSLQLADNKNTTTSSSLTAENTLLSDTSILAVAPVPRGRTSSLSPSLGTTQNNESFGKNPVSRPPPKRPPSLSGTFNSAGTSRNNSPSKGINNNNSSSSSPAVAAEQQATSFSITNPYDEDPEEVEMITAARMNNNNNNTTLKNKHDPSSRNNGKNKDAKAEEEDSKKKDKKSPVLSEKEQKKQHLVVGRRHIMNIHETSLLVFDYSHDENICNIRRAFFRAFDHWIFDLVLVILILYNLGYFIIDAPFGRALPGGAAVVEYSEYVIQGLFAIEMLMKIVSLGFALHPYAYCRDPLRFLEMIVVICGFIAIPLVDTKWRVLRNLKLIRLFRVLERIMQYVAELRGIFDALVGGLPRFADIVLFVAFLVLGLSIVGIQLFRGQFHNRCYFVPPTDSLADPSLFNNSVASSPYSESVSEQSSYLYDNLNFTDHVTRFYGASDQLLQNGLFNASRSVQQVDPASGNITTEVIPLSTVILDPLNFWPCSRPGDDDIETGGLTPCERGAACLKNVSIFEVPFTNFDHLGHAAFTVLKLTSIDSIQDEIRRMSYSTGSVSGIFGIVIVFLISFCAMNFFIALLSWEYDIACQRHLPERRKSNKNMTLAMTVITRNSADNTPIRDEETSSCSDDEDEANHKKQEGNNDIENNNNNHDDDDEEALERTRVEKIRKMEIARAKRITKLEKRLELKRERKDHLKTVEQSLPPWSDPLPLERDFFLPDEDEEELNDLMAGKPLTKQKKKPAPKKPEHDEEKKEAENVNADENNKNQNEDQDKEKEKENDENEEDAKDKEEITQKENDEKTKNQQEAKQDEFDDGFTRWERFVKSFRHVVGVTRMFIYDYFVGQAYFFWFSVFITVVNVTILAVFYEGMPQELADIFNWINFGCGIFFLFEMVIKLLILYPQYYFSLKTNIFDFALACAIIAELATLGDAASSSVFGALRAIRMLRIFSLAVKFERPRQTLLTVASAAKASFMLFLLLLAYVAIAALFAVYLFEDAIPLSDRPNFTDIPQSVLAMFIILAGENWVSIVIKVMQGSNGAAAVFFFIYFFFGTYLLLNLFVVIVISSYKHTAEEIAEWKIREQQEIKKEKEMQQKMAALQNSSPNSPYPNSPDREHLAPNNGQEQHSDEAIDQFQQNILQSVDRGHEANNNTNNHAVPSLNINALKNHTTTRGSGKNSPLDTAPPSAQITDRGNNKNNNRSSNNSPDQQQVENSPTIVSFDASANDAQNNNNNNNELASGTASPTNLGRTVREKKQKTFAHRLANLMGQDDYLSEEALRASLQGDSFYMFAPDNCFRVFCAIVVNHPFFEFCTTLIILESLIVLGFETRKNVEDIEYLLSDDLASDPFRVNNIFITCWFTMEMLLKMTAFGVFVKNSPKHKTYFSESWNQFDFIVVIITILSNVVPVSFLKALRIFRFAAKWRNQKVVLSAMLRAIPEFLNVVGLVLAFVFLVAVLGVQLFQGRFSSCNDPGVLLRSDCIGNYTVDRVWYEQRSETLLNDTTTAGENSSSVVGSILTTIIHNSSATVPRRWTTPFYNYDNTPNGLVSSLLLFWNDGWVPVLFNAVDSSSNSNIGLQETSWSTVPVLYFIGFTIIGNFFLHNLFIGTLLDLFKREHKREVGLSDEEGNQLLTSEQEQWIRNFRFAQATSLPDPPPAAQNKFRKICCYLYFEDDQVREDVSSLFEFTVSIAVFINVALMATEYEGMSEFWESFLFYENLVLTIFFAFEVIISFTALLPRAFIDDSNNIFNTLVTVASFISLRFAGPGINVLRVIRIFRILRVVRRARGVYRLFQALVYSIPQIANVSVLVVLILYVFGITATQLFGNAFIDPANPTEPLGYHYNFQHAGYSILTLTQLATTDGWAVVMEKMAHMSPENSGCVDGADADSDSNLACGNWYAIPFFTLFILVAHSIAINLYIFVIVDNVLELNELNDVRTQWMLAQLADFRKLWMQFDKRRQKSLRWQYLVLILRHMLVMERNSLKNFRREVGVPIKVFRSTAEDTLVVESLINERSADKHSAKGLELQIRSYYKRLRRRERRRRLEKMRQEFVEKEMEKQRQAVEAAAQAALSRANNNNNGTSSPFGGSMMNGRGKRRSPPGLPGSNNGPSNNFLISNPTLNAYEIILPEELELSSSSSDSDFYEDDDEPDNTFLSSSSSSDSENDVHEQIRRVKRRKILKERGQIADDNDNDYDSSSMSSKPSFKQVKMKRRKSNASNLIQSRNDSTDASQFAESGRSLNVSGVDAIGDTSSAISSGSNQTNTNNDNNSNNNNNNTNNRQKGKGFEVFHQQDVDDQPDFDDRKMGMKHVALSVIAQKQNAKQSTTDQNNNTSSKNNNNNEAVDDDTWCITEKFILKRLESLSIPVMKGGLVDYSDCIFGMTRAHSGTSTKEISGYAKEYLARVRDVDYSQTFQVHHAVAAMKIWRWWRRINLELEREMEEAAMDFMLRAALDQQTQQSHRAAQFLDRSQNSNNNNNSHHPFMFGTGLGSDDSVSGDSYESRANQNVAAAAALEALQKAGKMDDLKKAVERRQQLLQRRATGGGNNNNNKSSSTARGGSGGGGKASSNSNSRRRESRFRVNIPEYDPNNNTLNSDENTLNKSRSMLLDSTFGGGGSNDSRSNTPSRGGRRRSVTYLGDNNDDSNFLSPFQHQRGSSFGRRSSLPPIMIDTNETSCSTDPLPPDLSQALTRHLEREIEKTREENDAKKRAEEEKIAAEIKRRMQLEAQAKKMAEMRSGKRTFGHKPGSGSLVGIKRKKHEDKIKEEQQKQKEQEVSATSTQEMNPTLVVNNTAAASNSATAESSPQLSTRQGKIDTADPTRAPSPNQFPLYPPESSRTASPEPEQPPIAAPINHVGLGKSGAYKYFNDNNSIKKSTVQELVEKAKKDRAPPSVIVTAKAGKFAYYEGKPTTDNKAQPLKKSSTAAGTDDTNKNKNNSSSKSLALSSQNSRLSPELAASASDPAQRKNYEQNKSFESAAVKNPANKHLGRIQALLDTTKRRQQELDKQEEEEKKRRAERAEERERKKDPKGTAQRKLDQETAAKSYVLKQVEDPETKKKFSAAAVKQRQEDDFFLDDDNINDHTTDDTTDDADEITDKTDLPKAGGKKLTNSKHSAVTREPTTVSEDDIFDDLTDQRPPTNTEQRAFFSPPPPAVATSASSPFFNRNNFSNVAVNGQQQPNSNQKPSSSSFASIMTMNKIAKCSKRFDPQTHRVDYQQLFSFIPNDAPLLAVNVGQLVSVHDTIVSGTPHLFGWALCARIAKPSMRGYVPIDCICDAVNGSSIVGQESIRSSPRGGVDNHRQQEEDTEPVNNNINSNNDHPHHQSSRIVMPPTHQNVQHDTSLVQSPRPTEHQQQHDDSTMMRNPLAPASSSTHQYVDPNQNNRIGNNNDHRNFVVNPTSTASFGKRAFVQYDFEAVDPVELSVRAGELVQVEVEEEDGWTRVRMIGPSLASKKNLPSAADHSPNGSDLTVGLVPTNYLKILEDVVAAPPPPSRPLRPPPEEIIHQHRTPSQQKEEFFSPALHDDGCQEDDTDNNNKEEEFNNNRDINQPLFPNRKFDSRDNLMATHHQHLHPTVDEEDDEIQEIINKKSDLEMELTAQLEKVTKVDQEREKHQEAKKKHETSEQSLRERLDALKTRLRNSKNLDSSSAPY